MGLSLNAERGMRSGDGFKHLTAMAMVAVAFEACVSGTEVHGAEQSGRGPDEWVEVTT